MEFQRFDSDKCEAVFVHTDESGEVKEGRLPLVSEGVPGSGTIEVFIGGHFLTVPLSSPYTVVDSVQRLLKYALSGVPQDANNPEVTRRMVNGRPETEDGRKARIATIRTQAAQARVQGFAELASDLEWMAHELEGGRIA